VSKQIQIKNCSVDGLWYSDMDTYKDRFYYVVDEPKHQVTFHDNKAYNVYLIKRGVEVYVVIKDDVEIVIKD